MPKADLNELLATGVHDAKNLIMLLMQEVDSLHGELPDARIAGIQDRLGRINDRLVQMLSLYRMESGSYPLDIGYHGVDDFLEDCAIEIAPILDGKPVSFHGAGTGDASLCWFFDRNLCAGIVVNALHNALAFARSEVVLAARLEDGMLVISVSDDGKGFENPPSCVSMDLGQGRTGLGIHFSRLAAALHENQGRTGEVRIRSEAGKGTALELCLP